MAGYIDFAVWGETFAGVLETWAPMLAAQPWARCELRSENGSVVGRLGGNITSAGVEPKRGVVVIEADLEGRSASSKRVWVDGHCRYALVSWPDGELPAQLAIDGTIVATAEDPGDLEVRSEAALAALRAQYGVLAIDFVGMGDADWVRIVAEDSREVIGDLVSVLVANHVEQCSIEVHGRVVECRAPGAARFDWSALELPILTIDVETRGWRFARGSAEIGRGDSWEYGSDDDAREDPVVGALFDDALYAVGNAEHADTTARADDDLPF
jgi:hypothetical protein